MIHPRRGVGATLSTLLAALALCVATRALSEPLIINGQPVAWPAGAWPIPLADAGLSWRRVAAAWTAGAAAFAPVAQAPVQPDGVIALVEWGAARWAADVGDPALVGFTLITHEGGALMDADVVLNVDRFRFSEAVDPRSFHRPTTLAHELGHALGLGHVDAVGALMHAAQEPGVAGAVDAGALADLSEVSTCCVAIRRPTLAGVSGQRMALLDVAPDDSARSHGAVITDLQIDADGTVELLIGAHAVEVWTTPGQGGVFDVPDAALDASADAGLDAGADAMMTVAVPDPAPGRDGGCGQAGPSAPQSWILPGVLSLLGFWRRR